MNDFDIQSIRGEGERKRFAFALLAFFVLAVGVPSFLISRSETLSGYLVEFVVFALAVVGIAAYMASGRRQQLIAKMLRVSTNQLPHVFDAALAAETNLNLKLIDSGKVELYVFNSPEFQVYSVGYFKQSIAISSNIVNNASAAQLQFLIGRQLTHIALHHTFWMNFLHEDAAQIPVLSSILRIVFGVWLRRIELTGDDGGLVACNQSHDVATSTLIAEFVDWPNANETCLTSIKKQALAIESSSTQKSYRLFSSHAPLPSRILRLSERL